MKGYSYQGNVVLLSIWYGMILTQILNSNVQRFLNLEMHTEYQYLMDNL